MESIHKLQIKLGDAEFSAEGPDALVREAFEKFLQALQARGATPPLLAKENGSGEREEAKDAQEAGPPSSVLDRLFKVEGEIVTLQLLPPSESTNRPGDAAILVLYGFKTVRKLDTVPVTKLNDALRKSGINVERVDRTLAGHSGLYMKGGAKSGGKYTLNNQGVAQAERWINGWFS